MPSKGNGGFFNDGREKLLQDYVFTQDFSYLRNNPQAILRVINDYVENKSGMMIFRKNKLAVSRQVINGMNPKPKTIVELGTYVGNSAIYWGAMLQELHSAAELPACHVFSMELEENLVKIAQSFLKLGGLQDIVEVMKGESAQSLKNLKSSNRVQHIDMLFIDHWEKFYLSDLQLCEDLNLLRNGTVIIADNTDMPGAPDYLAYVRSGGRDNGYKYETKTLKTTKEVRVPNVLEVTMVVAVP